MVGAMDEVVLINDFSGGLNDVDLIGTLLDNELETCENFDITSTRRLVSRAPFTAHGSAAPVAGQLTHLGWFLDDQGNYFAVVTSTGARTWLVDDETGVYTQIAAWTATDCEQYGGKLYLTQAAAAGGYWANTTPGSSYSLTLLNGANPMPAGNRIRAHKGRLWVSTGTSLYYSKVTSISAGTNVWEWDGSFINVSPGDGQVITELGVSFDDLLVFRSSSTWLLSYTDTLADAALTQINGDIGARDWRCVARNEDSYYVLSGTKLFMLTSRVYYPLHSDRKLALREDGVFATYSLDFAVSVFGERVIVWVRGTCYVLHTSVQGWSTYVSESSRFAHGIQHPASAAVFGASAIFGTSGSSEAGRARQMFFAVDKTLQSGGELMTCTLQTKAFDWKDPSQLKHMFAWGLDVVSKNPVKGRARPLGLITTVVTYDEMNAPGITFDVLNLGTWDYPLVIPNFVEATRDIPGVAPVQVYAKMMQAMWFRQASFEVVLTTHGTFVDGPVRVEAIATIVQVKNRAPDAVS